MVFKRFFLKISAFIILICLFGAIVIWSFWQEDLTASRFILTGIWALLIFFLIRMILHALNPMEKFLNTLQSDDLINIPARKHFLSKEINETYQYIHQILQKVKTDKEEQYHLFQNSIDHISSGILVFNERGEIRLKNKAVSSIFPKKPLHHIKKLADYDSAIPELLLDSSQNRGLIKFKTNGELKKVSLQIQDFILKDEKLRIASLQNISEELEKEELLAWKKLLHVITHEIMNSVTPMKTLSYSLQETFPGQGELITKDQLTNQQIYDLQEGLSAINTRITGLMNFVDSYRKLYKIPQPNIKKFSLQQMISEIKTLFANEMRQKGIEFNINGNPSGTLLADKEMISQVLINLVKNAMESFDKQTIPNISLNIKHKNNETAIQVMDNGKGMNEEELQNCFVPFYTTKDKGTGIGLYYSRLIALLNKGNLTAKSEYGNGSVFTLTL
jgi:nitrogen fixation/metabolism regulation signal transduction histidine kinase